jgi:cyclohexadienyl dehydratase
MKNARSPAVFLAVVCLFSQSIYADASISAAHYSSAEDRVARVLTLADERLALMPAVAAAKWIEHVPVLDPAREAGVVRAAVEAGALLGLAPMATHAFFELQIRFARETQRERIDEWGKSGFTFAPPVPSLSLDLRPKLDELTHALVRAIYLAVPTPRSDDATNRYAPLAAQLLPAPRWTNERRELLLAALGEIRLSGPSSLERAKAAGALRIGTPGDYAPFSVETNGMLSGFDIELAQRLASRLGLEPVFIPTSWLALLDDLRADRFDIAIGGISVSAERLAAGVFSPAIVSGGKTAIGKCSDAVRFRRFGLIDRRGVRVIVNPGGTNEKFVRKELRHASVTVYPDNRSIFEELQAGRADVMFTDDTEVTLQTHRHPELCRLLPDVYWRADKSFLMQRSTSLNRAVHDWFNDEARAGVPAQLLHKYLAE